jgi:hypothetical protein
MVARIVDFDPEAVIILTSNFGQYPISLLAISPATDTFASSG